MDCAMTDSRKEPTEEREEPVDPAIFERPEVQAKIARALKATRKEPTEECPICGERPTYALYEHLADVHDGMEVARAVESLRQENERLREGLERVRVLLESVEGKHPDEVDWHTVTNRSFTEGQQRPGGPVNQLGTESGVLLSKYVWLVTGGWLRLHYVPAVDDRPDATSGWSYWEGYWERDSQPVYAAACGMEATWQLPGIFTRMGCERCSHCCDRLGIPRGYGAPMNHTDERMAGQ